MEAKPLLQFPWIYSLPMLHQRLEFLIAGFERPRHRLVICGQPLAASFRNIAF